MILLHEGDEDEEQDEKDDDAESESTNYWKKVREKKDEEVRERDEGLDGFEMKEGLLGLTIAPPMF